MPSLRDEITKTLGRLRARKANKAEDLQDTVLATDSREGRYYGNYRVLRRLGVGGMGHVYLALDTHLGRHAALKYLSPKLKSNPDMLARLQQEARTASSLNHPNILTIYDIAEADGETFIASEFIDGVTLRQALERGAIGPTSALDIAIQIVSALKPAHEAGVIHRDLKPGNVMLRPDGLVKVIDFGLAKFMAHGLVAPSYEPLTDPGSVAGTVQYMSPEQARGDDVDQRTDLWSLGVMLYEMVAQAKPFDGETESHIIVAILDRQPSALKTVAGVPSGLARVVEKALAKNPDKRYQTAQEMFSALKALDVSSQSRPSRVFAAAIAKRHKHRTFLFSALAAAALAVLVLWWWLQYGREAVLGPAWFAPLNYTQVTHRGDVNLAALSPNGKRIAYTSLKDGQTTLHLLNLETHQETSWSPYAGETLGITFSADSSTVYFTVHDQREWGQLYAAKEAAGEPRVVLDDIDGPVAFSPDGSKFAFHRRFDEKRTNREAIVIAETRDTGSQRILLSKYNEAVGSRVAWSSSGLMAVNLPKLTLEGVSRPTVLLFLEDGKEVAEHTDAGLRRLTGPAFLDKGAMLVFAGCGRGGDESEAVLVQLNSHTGQFRFFPSVTLTPNGLTVSRDFQQIGAVKLSRLSGLWVADARTLDQPEKWSSDDSFTSLSWTSDDAIVHPSSRGGNVALWQVRRGGDTRPLPQKSGCESQYPASIPGTGNVVYSSNCDDVANASNLWSLNAKNGKLAKVTDHSLYDKKASVSPDGDTVLYNAWPSNYPALMKISLKTRVKYQFTPLNARNAAISPDGHFVACQVRENYDGKWRAVTLSMRDGSIQKDNLPLPAELDSVIRWSPDGKALDYINPVDSSNIWRLPMDSLHAQPLTHLHGHPITDFGWNYSGTKLAWVASDVQQDVIIFHTGDNR